MDNTSLETFSLVWLDRNPNENDLRNTEQQLRTIINHLKKFQTVKECLNYIGGRSQIDRIVMMVSGQLGREIVPLIHNYRHIVAVYVYCMNKKLNEEWASKFTKVI